MITIHATKKLFAKLPVNERGCLPEGEKYSATKGAANESHVDAHTAYDNSLLSGWHGNLITVQRRNCILFTHDTTRFAMFIPCLTKADFARLDYFFQDVLMNTLLKCNFTDQQLNLAAAQLHSLCFDTQCDRSVLGTLNQMKGDLEHMLRFDNLNITDLSPYKTSQWLSDRPCSIKGMKNKECLWPIKAMGSLLSEEQVD